MSSGAEELEMDEVAEITDFIQEEAGLTAEIIWGSGTDDSLEDAISITVIATGFSTNSDVEYSVGHATAKVKEKVIHQLSDDNNEALSPSLETTEDSNEEDDMKLISRPQNDNLTTASPELSGNIRATTTQPALQDEDKKVIIHSLDDDVDSYEVAQNKHNIDKEEPQSQIDTAFRQKADERINRLRGLSHRFGAAEELTETESTPAYVRRGVSLSETPAADESNVSRYTLDSETGEMKSNNSFLHDNVD